MFRFRCENCGEIFDEPETISWVEPIGEEMCILVCQSCCSEDLTIVYPCYCCDGNFLRDELYEGVCIECLKEALNNFSCALNYLLARGYLYTFISEKILTMSQQEYFTSIKSSDVNLHELLIQFVIEDDECGAYDFVRWLRNSYLGEVPN